MSGDASLNNYRWSMLKYSFTMKQQSSGTTNFWLQPIPKISANWNHPRYRGKYQGFEAANHTFSAVLWETCFAVPWWEHSLAVSAWDHWSWWSIRWEIRLPSFAGTPRQTCLQTAPAWQVHRSRTTEQRPQGQINSGIIRLWRNMELPRGRCDENEIVWQAETQLSSWYSSTDIYSLCHHVPQFTDDWLSGKEPFTRFTMLLETSLSRRCRLWPHMIWIRYRGHKYLSNVKYVKVLKSFEICPNIQISVGFLLDLLSPTNIYKLLTSTTWVVTTPSHQVKSSQGRSCPHVGVAIATPVVEVRMIVLDGVQKRRGEKLRKPIEKPCQSNSLGMKSLHVTNQFS